MGLILNRPTKDAKGNSISLEFLPEDSLICLSISRQSKSEKEGLYSFDDREKFRINFGIKEACGILAVIRKNISYDKKIEFKDGYSIIRFEPIFKEKRQTGFALGITIKEKTERKIIAGIDWAETIAIEEWLRFALYNIFVGTYRLSKSGKE